MNALRYSETCLFCFVAMERDNIHLSANKYSTKYSSVQRGLLQRVDKNSTFWEHILDHWSELRSAPTTKKYAVV